MQKYEIVLEIPRESHGLKSRIEAALLEEWPGSEITFEETDLDQCLVTGVTIPNSSRMTDANSGEEVATKGMMVAAQTIVVETCRDDSSGF
jgi:hypothetical protein